MKLNLEAKNDAEKKLLEYLENNASEALAEKINNGTPYEKNGKNLINKKDLVGFLNYANCEARKLAEKGKNYACVKAQTVFGWTMHYFEEDTIVGTLYNPDGTKYEEPKKTTPKTTCCVSNPTPPKPKEPTLFDLLSNETPEKQKPEEKPKGIEIKEEKPPEQPDPIIIQDNKKINLETGEILQEYPSIDKHSMLILYNILDGELEVQ